MAVPSSTREGVRVSEGRVRPQCSPLTLTGGAPGPGLHGERALRRGGDATYHQFVPRTAAPRIFVGGQPLFKRGEYSLLFFRFLLNRDIWSCFRYYFSAPEHHVGDFTIVARPDRKGLLSIRTHADLGFEILNIILPT
jgi:hypothetical protein